jgi:hypothetical protein
MRQISRFSALALFTIAAASANAGMDVSCQDPMLFEDAGVNVVFVPAQSSKGEFSERAQEVVLLMQRQTLFSLLPYGSVGVERLYSSPGKPCELESVKQQLLSPGGGSHGGLQPGHAIVFIAARLYEEGDEIYMQTFLDFSFYRVSDTVSFDVRAPDSAGAFAVEPSQRVLTFAPRRLSKDALEKLHADYLAAAVLHKDPDDSSQGEELKLQPQEPFAYVVVNAKDGWMEVNSLLDGRRGWTRGTAGGSESTIAQALPELDIIEGTVGYLLMRVKAASGEGQVRLNIPVGRDRLATLTTTAMSRYLDRASETDSRRTLSTVRVLLGTSHLSNGVVGPSDPGLERAEDDYRRAVELDPYNSDALQLRSLVQLSIASRDGGPRDPALVAAHNGLWKAAALAPEDKSVARNLQQLYRLSGARAEVFRLNADQLRQRQTQLDAVARGAQ